MYYYYSVAIIFLTCTGIALTFPSLDISGNNIQKCHFLDCPAETSICERNTTTLENPNVIRTLVICKNIHGKVLLTNSTDVPNDKKGYKTNVYKFTLNYSRRNTQVDNLKL